MSIKQLIGVALMMLVTSSALPAEQILDHLNKSHPRLLATTADFDRLRQQVQAGGEPGRLHDKLVHEVEKILIAPPSKYEIPDGLRLLGTSRRVLDRVTILAMLYRLDGDRRYLDRAWAELDAASQFPDWNPRHFLDTAEMTHAFAIGYDWLYDAWTPEQRATLRHALIEKGLQPALACYRGESKFGWWVKAHHNWNQVCNGGIGLGALAIADEEPALATEILTAAIKSLPLAMREYGPDGAWAEGPGYWHYATSYTVAFLAGLESALGTDFGLAQTPGFSETGLFPIYLTGPLGRTFNFADGGDGNIHAPEMFWLARKFNRPEYAAYERKWMRASPLDLLWYDDQPGQPLPLDRYFRKVEAVTFRSRWDDTNAVFVAFKGGDNQANHSHLDLGTFVLDALGERWAVNLGKENYNLPGYFGKLRWTYYRLRAEGANTLVINPDNEPDQNPKAAAKIIRYESQPARAFAIADLTSAYGVSKVERGVALLDRKTALVQDEITAAQPADVWWFLHTAAQITISADGTTATLEKNNARLTAQILAPGPARFTVMDPRPLPTSPNPSGQNANVGIRKLAIHLPRVTNTTVTVRFVPDGADAKPGEVIPLAQW